MKYLFSSAQFANNTSEYLNKTQYFKNYPASWNYEIGSTFKGVTLAFLLENGLYKKDQLYDVSEGFRINKWQIHDSHLIKEKINSDEVFIKSSNIGISKMLKSIPRDEFYNFLKK